MVHPAGRGSNLDSVRRHNLSTVLGIVHLKGMVSRADLTRATGLNRSTIAALSTELEDLGLVVESEPDAVGRVGRPSPLLAPSADVVAVAVNPEIDAVTVGLVGLDGRVRSRVRRETDHAPSAEEATALAADAITELTAATPGVRIAGVGVAVPGLVRRADGVVRFAPHLGWADAPLQALLTQATGLSVAAGNDAQLGAYAEHLFGAGVGVDDLLYVNGGSSGIGGGIISGGNAFMGASGHAGEIGHIRVGAGVGEDSAGLQGTLESEVSRSRLLDALRLGPVAPEVFNDALLNSTDAAVLEEARRQLRVLGVALGSAVTLLNSQLIVLGGFLGTLYELDTALLDSVVAQTSLHASREGMRTARTSLGSDILLVGAAELAFTALLADPAAALAG